jgi:hypothetical protein
MIKKNFSKLKKTFSEESTTSNQSPNPFEVEKQIKLISIFDWDDTLFCTKYFDTFNLNYSDIFSFKTSLQDFNPYLLNELKDLENSIINLFLELIENNFEIFIISNADKKWIDNCLIHFFQELKEFIEENSIKIYSAKNMFSSITNSNYWKKKCFKKVILDNYKDNNLEIKILSIGDSFNEKRATLNLRKINFFNKIKVQFIKMIFCPSAISIILQLKYIENNLKDIIQKQSLLFKMVIEQKNYGIEINCNDDFEEEYEENDENEDDNNKEINNKEENVCINLLNHFLKKKRKLKEI